MKFYSNYPNTLYMDNIFLGAFCSFLAERGAFLGAFYFFFYISFSWGGPDDVTEWNEYIIVGPSPSLSSGRVGDSII